MKDAIKIANKFSSTLREWLTTEELQEINDKNAEYKANGEPHCATHEYCDPNQAMIDACDSISITEPHLNMLYKNMFTEYNDLIDDAWKLAKDNKFQQIKKESD